MKNITRMLVMLTCCIVACASFAQKRDPSKEILIFFKEGVKSEKKMIAGRSISQTVIKSDGLRKSLSNLGLSESALEIANTKFQEPDTLTIMQDGTYIKQLNMTRLFRVRVEDSKSREKLIAELIKMPEVLYAEENIKLCTQAIPNDVQYRNQWGLRNTWFAGRDIHAERAWDIFTGNPNNIIAVVDEGVDINHSDLSQKIMGGATGMGSFHGTHVAGIAAASSNNSQGISGVDWNAKIYPARMDEGDMVDVYNSIVGAVNFSPNVVVLNHSWGIGGEKTEEQIADIGKNSLTLQQAFAYAYKANRTSVVAMGNYQKVRPDKVGYPAAYDGVIAVGATNIVDEIGDFSVHNTYIDVSAPGVGITSTDTLSGYKSRSGTSMATPFISGIVSLLKGYNPNLANDDIENIIRLSADDVNANVLPGFDPIYGAGRANAEQALKLLIAPNALNQWTATGGAIASSTGNYSVQFLGAQGIAAGTYSVKRHEVTKTVTFPNSFCQITGAWGRGVSTTGWSAASPNFGMGYSEVVPGTLTNTGVTLRTYVYEVWNVLGQSLGYYPTTPANVTFAYTVIGVPNINASIFGASSVCSDGSTFRIRNVPSGASVSWSASSNISINASGIAYSLSEGSTGWIRATINGVCGNPVLTKNVWVGNVGGTGGIKVRGNAYPDPGGIYVYSLSTVPTGNGTISYRWRIPSGNGWEPYSDTDASFMNVMVGTTQGSVEAYWSNECGQETGTYIFVRPSGSGGGGGGGGGPGPHPLSVFPNPVSTDLTISAVDLDNAQTSKVSAINSSNLDIRLLDKFSQVVRSGKLKDGKIVLNVKDLPDGVYFLKVNSNSEELITKQIVVRH